MNTFGYCFCAIHQLCHDQTSHLSPSFFQGRTRHEVLFELDVKPLGRVTIEHLIYLMVCVWSVVLLCCDFVTSLVLMDLCNHYPYHTWFIAAQWQWNLTVWASYQIRKITGCACAGNVSPSSRISDPDMHHGTCVTHVPWCMPESLTSSFIWNRVRGKRFRHSRCMRNPQFFVSDKRPIRVNL